MSRTVPLIDIPKAAVRFAYVIDLYTGPGSFFTVNDFIATVIQLSRGVRKNVNILLMA